MNRRILYQHRLWIGCVALFLVLFSCAIWGYRMVWGANFFPERATYIYIDEQTDWEGLCVQLVDSVGCVSLGSFRLLADWMDYPDRLRTGRYRVEPGMGNLELIRDLRNGHQAAVRLTFQSTRTLEGLTEKIDRQLMLRGKELLQMMGDSAWCDSMGFNCQTIPALFIPNTYEVYWNISPQAFMQRMHREYRAFWNEERRKQAEAVGLTPLQVATLASIVDEESAMVDEYPLIAGLYLNRLRAGIPLQADPTVKFAVGDLSLQRILNKHLAVDSPYNTYKHPGLPPGPIRIPSLQALRAVLRPAHHRYLYMCAKEDFSGRHNFAVNLQQHSRNAARYRAELNRRGIY